MHYSVDFQSQGPERDPRKSRGGIGADERGDLEELLLPYPQKRLLKAQAQILASHPRCILEEIWFP